jgi:serine/threonine-protein kinase HipA
MILEVYITLPNGEYLIAGELVFGDPDGQGNYASAFRYHEDWLDSENAFPLDPCHLPLSADEVGGKDLIGRLAVFADSLPDEWGKRLLVMKNKLPRREQSDPYLLKALANHGMGALSFFEPGHASEAGDPSSSLLELEHLIISAQKLESNAEMIDREIRELLKAGSSPGGARPKALVRSENGVLWLAKFPSRKDRFDVVGLEAAALHCAQKAGLIVPDFRMVEVGKQRALLVKRFDVEGQNGRRHMISFKTLCGKAGYYFAGYADMIDAIRKYSASPKNDATALFRQMVFNAVLGNTDDHLKNFLMLHYPEGYRLSPAFDLLPDVARNREHILAFQYDNYPPGAAVLKTLGKSWGINRPDQIIAEVVDGVGYYASACEKFAVPGADADFFVLDIQKRAVD